MSKNKGFDDRYLIGGRIGFIGDETMGKTHKAHEVMAQVIAKSAQVGYFALYFDLMGDTLRYRYFDDWTRIKSLSEMKDNPDNAYILDLHSGGSLENILKGAQSLDDIFIEAARIIARISKANPEAQMIWMINEAQNFFPNVNYTGDDNLAKVRRFLLSQLNHIRLLLFWTLPDIRFCSTQLVARSNDLISFRVQDNIALNRIGEISKDITSKMSDVPLEKIKKLKAREYVIIKSSGRFF